MKCKETTEERSMEPIIGWRIDSNMGKESLQMHDKKLKRINRYTKMIRHDRKK